MSRIIVQYNVCMEHVCTIGHVRYPAFPRSLSPYLGSPRSCSARAQESKQAKPAAASRLHGRTCFSKALLRLSANVGQAILASGFGREEEWEGEGGVVKRAKRIFHT